MVMGGSQGAKSMNNAAVEILKTKKKGNYNIVQIDPSYVPEQLERKQVYGITFEQGRNELDVNAGLLDNIVTKNKDLPKEAMNIIFYGNGGENMHDVEADADLHGAEDSAADGAYNKRGTGIVAVYNYFFRFFVL